MNVLNGFDFSAYIAFLLFLSLSFFFIGYLANKKVHPIAQYNGLKKRRYFLKFMLLIVLKFALLNLKLYTNGFTLQEYFVNMLFYHSHYGKLGGYVWNIIEQPVQAIFFILSYKYIIERRNLRSVIIIALIGLAMQLAGLSQSRWGYIQALFILPMVYWTVLVKRKPGLNPMVILLAPLIGGLMAIMNNIRNGYSWNNAFSDGALAAIISQIAGDAEPARNFNVLIERLDDFNYGYYLLLQIVSIIPRAIWPTKPYTSMLVNYTDIYFNIDAIKDGKTLTFTFMDYYTLGGVITLIIGMYLTGRFLNFVYKKIYAGSIKYFVLFVPIMINLINYYRGSFLDGLLLTTVQLFSYYLIYRLLFRKVTLS